MSYKDMAREVQVRCGGDWWELYRNPSPTCLHCKKPMYSNHVQQGNCHMGCYDEYINEEIKVWKVCLDGSCYIHPESQIDLTLLGDGETAQVAKYKRIEILKMKEFKGF